MDKDTESRFKLLLRKAKKRRFVLYEELSTLFPKGYDGGPELDKVLSKLEQGAVEIRPKATDTLDLFPDDLSNFDEDPVKVYLREVGRVPRLAPERVIELSSEIESKGRDAERAKKELAEAYLRLVAGIAQQYKAPGFHVLDLIQQGNLGLFHAVSTFGPSRNYRFATYATFWVNHSLDDMVSKGPPEPVIPVHRR
jgi:RNA polymerase primary sigma factor